jgi:uncharacterized protein DUF4105
VIRLALAAALSAVTPAVVQAPPPTAHQPTPTRPEGAQLTVTLLTIETGGLIWERFGHNGIWIHDAVAGTDHLYDYGRFSFTQAHFFYNFARGRMWYSMGDTNDVAAVIDFYAREGRKIWAQELDLAPEARAKLRDFLEWNIRPENRGYAYDYYRDNCSTRIRDALDRALGGPIARYGVQPSGMTWREETRRLDEHDALLYTGLMIGLGRPVDREMSRWEQMFLPIRLREHLDRITVTGPDGVARPVVKSERVLAPGGSWPVPDRPHDWTVRYLAAGLLLGGVMAWLGARGAGWARGAFLALGTLWALVGGVLGLVLTWLWAFSSHVAAHANENVLLFNLLALGLAVVLPAAVRGNPRRGNAARRLALWIAALAALGVVLKIVPGFHQSNLDLIALALPAHAGVWLGLRSRPPA